MRGVLCQPQHRAALLRTTAIMPAQAPMWQRAVSHSIHQSPFTSTIQTRTFAESGWMGKLGKMIGLGKDSEQAPATTDSSTSSSSPVASESTQEMTLESYFSFVEKAKLARKMGLGGMMDKMLGGGDTKAIDELWNKHPGIQSALTAQELKSTSPMFTQERLRELSVQSSVPEDQLHQVFSMFARAKAAYQMFEAAKAQGRTPKSIEDVQAMAQEFAQKPQFHNPTPIVKPSPSPPRPSPATPAPASPSASPSPARPSITPPSAMGQRAVAFTADRFKASPKKDDDKDKRLGRNDWVQVTNGSETQTLKWKKAQPLVDSGKWKLVD